LAIGVNGERAAALCGIAGLAAAAALVSSEAFEACWFGVTLILCPFAV
jgi:hypothetical protein